MPKPRFKPKKYNYPKGEGPAWALGASLAPGMKAEDGIYSSMETGTGLIRPWMKEESERMKQRIKRRANKEHNEAMGKSENVMEREVPTELRKKRFK